jgi:hypothetical protein
VGARSARAAKVPQKHKPKKDNVDRLVAEADKYAKGKNGKLDEPKFREVVEVLWWYFLEGAHPVGLAPSVNDATEREILDEAFRIKSNKWQTPSGHLIVDSLKKWDDDEHEPRTNGCAYMAGRYAADKAIQNNQNDPSIGVEEFIYGWRETEKKMALLLSRAQSGASRESLAKILGFGC